MSPFSTRLAFFTLSFIGLICVHLLSFKLTPDRVYPSLKVSCNWIGVSQTAIESEITSKIEGVLSSIDNYRRIYSKTYPGYSEVYIEFDQDVDLGKQRFKISSLIKQIYGTFPESVTYPTITFVRPEGQNPTLISYAVSSNLDPASIQKFINAIVVPTLTKIKGINSIQLDGVNERCVSVRYDSKMLIRFGIQDTELIMTIQDHLRRVTFGKAGVRFSRGTEELLLSSPLNISPIDLGDLPIKRVNTRSIKLKDVATIEERYLSTPYQYRVNGLETISITVTSHLNTNQIELGERVKEAMNEIQRSLLDYKLTVTYDSIEYLKTELRGMGFRALISILLVFIMTFIFYRSLQYILILFLGQVITTLISVIFLVALSIDIHMYSLIAFSVSIGFIVDNSMISIDHCRRTGNRDMIKPILGATATTVVPLLFLPVMEDSVRLNLMEFGWVIIIMLCSSLVVSGWFIPNLVFPSSDLRNKWGIAVLRTCVKLNHSYLSVLFALRKYRTAISVLIVFLIGMPFFLLPQKLNEEQFGSKLYNITIGGDFYSKTIRPIADKVLGGSLRLFIESTSEDNSINESSNELYQRFSLKLILNAPFGSTIEHLNGICQNYEHFLSQEAAVGIELFETKIFNNQNAQIEIFFKDAYVSNDFPYLLKGAIERESLKFSGINFVLVGVGEPFGTGVGNFVDSNLILSGYSYDQLVGYANLVKQELGRNFRIEDVRIKSEPSWLVRSNRQYVAEVNHQMGSDVLRSIYSNFGEISITDINTGTDILPVILESNESNKNSFNDLMNKYSYVNDSLVFRSKFALNIDLNEVPESIFKENQEYRLTVQYKFKGTRKLNTIVNQQLIEEFSKILPPGYQISEANAEGIRRGNLIMYRVILASILIIFAVCAILLESIQKALLIVICIPISLAGVFFALYQFQITISNGIYAAIVLQVGLLVNSAIFLLIGFRPRRDEKTSKAYMRAFNKKIVPITITILSTLAGLFPFIFDVDLQTFSFSFSLATAVGISLSFIVVIFILPIYLIEGKSDKSNS